MVPVRLRLENFLSYGTAAPVLDFEQFHVACLSGRNGQGKSALLDAITWAIWGEARKVSDSRKPDAELLRMGARRMEVDLTFDLDSDRYRVIRSYEKSASGKTSKSSLELQSFDAATNDYRPVTGANQRETQATIETVVGLDYNTFINSAFLLQGRSDEFTKKRPTERKEILARILDLGRYEALGDLVKERLRQLNERLRNADQEIERLGQNLIDEAAWTASFEATSAALASHDVVMQLLEAEEQALTAEHVRYDARKREIQTLVQAAAALATRADADTQEKNRLLKRLEEADALIRQQDQIQADYDRYQQLTTERNALDHKRDLFRGVEKQLEQKQRERNDHKNEYEKALHQLDSNIRADEEAIRACEAELFERPALERKLAGARDAQVLYRRLQEQKNARDKLNVERDQAQRGIDLERQGLESRLQGLREQHAHAKANQIDDVAKQEELRQLRQQQQRQEAAEAERERLLQEGQVGKEALRELIGKRTALSEDLTRQHAARQTLIEAAFSTCPTCGTALTDEHRETVTGHYDARLVTLDDDLRSLNASISEKELDLAAKRQAYRAADQLFKAFDGMQSRMAQVANHLEQAKDQARTMAQLEQEMAGFSERLERGSYGDAWKEKLVSLQASIDAIDFDEVAFAAAREKNAQLPLLEEHLQRLVQVDARKEQLARRLAQRQTEARAKREMLESGGIFRTYDEHIGRLNMQLQQVGFDATRFEEVRRLLHDMRLAGDRLKDLVHAQRNKGEWEGQVTRLSEQLAQAVQEQAALISQRSEIEAKQAGYQALVAKLDDVATRRKAAAETQQELQRERGKLETLLAQAAKDRAALKSAQASVKASLTKRTLNAQLREAFGRNGIPALIIESSLPDIEQRANELLSRLTDGRMHIQLETIKDKKTGGTKETLDIKITDEQGISRPYETFSGGEAFRVNFSLRIALAKILAERSVVRIRTLVIDEGFGTQDEQGVESLVEAIQTIQEDFDKIIVITHLNQLKEAFPVRIEVRKDPVQGSKFEVLGV